ncbi:MAG: ABC-F family ATP-binding cassette domain-containing protein [Sphaerochaeta sp.]|nr:ABC-F family ATP-binding cassette domain-containing protein [Sphaerochaeta sp.]
MNVLSLENISKTLNEEPLFSAVSFGLEGGDHVGLIGQNGTGKSTFLRLLKGELPPDSGTIATARESELIMLTQQMLFTSEDTVRSYLYKGEGKRIALVNAYHKVIGKKQDSQTKRELATLTEQLDLTGSWNLESDYTSLLGELGLFEKLDEPMQNLSGGMQKKAAIARVLCAKPTLLLLDEPTNHLDIETIEWLEKYLRDSSMTMIIVTHDRYFLDAVCNAILELDRGSMYLHPGSFSAFLERRTERLSMMQKEQDRLSVVLRRELEWLKRGPRARTGKDTNRQDRIKGMLSLQKDVSETVQSSFASSNRRLGKKILEVKNISKRYEQIPVISDFSYSFTKGQKIGVVGPNGSGKSTLLDLLSGHTATDTGERDAGINTVFAYYDQEGRKLSSEKGVLEFVQDISERITLSEGQIVTAARFLEIFGFPPTMHRSSIATLSGGEKRRLYLISRLVKDPNFLMLDEPTNDLDLPTMENLEQYVQDFSGCTLVVSHDRAFLDLTCDELFVLDMEGNVSFYPGPYSEWRAFELRKREQAKKEEAEHKAIADRRDTAQAPSRKNEKKGLSFREKKELDELNAAMEELHILQRTLEESFSDALETELGTLAVRSETYHANSETLAKMEDRWLELSEKE